jgi:hypothetical protein
VAALFYVLHFLHLRADFPNNSPWVDWSKYTDEGWYGDAAIRHYLFGHWYFPGDFNPAVALPVWPALELVWFKFTGVGPAAARALTLVVFAATLATFYLLLRRHTRPRSDHSGQPLAAPLAVFFLCTSPLLYVFERMAILEPLLICLTALALLTASYLHPFHLSHFRPRKKSQDKSALKGTGFSPYVEGSVESGALAPEGTSLQERDSPVQSFLKSILPTVFLTLLLPAIVLTKTTGICLFPAIFYMVWARAGYRIRPALRLGVPPAIGGIVLWCAYYFGFVKPHYLEDYRYLFSANAYTGIELEPLAKVVLNTIADGAWMGHALYIVFFLVLALVVFWRPRLFTNPLFVSLLLWIGGYFAFLAYHNNLQPRYYLVVAVPITAVVALCLDNFRQRNTSGGPFIAELHPAMSGVATILITATVLLISIPDAIQQLGYVLHPTYDFEAAAQGIQQLVLADHDHPHLILSISGSDLTLMTGLPSIDDDFGTLDLDKRVKDYRPGWYVAWNDIEDDKADSLIPLYTIHRVAAFPAYDDADRNLLILYRLDPTEPTPAIQPKKRHTPKPLISKLGQQPSTEQLQH